MSYWPVESRLKCEWIYCYAGMGIAGSGHCFAGGAWWMQCCPEFIDEKEYIKKWKEEAAQYNQILMDMTQVDKKQIQGLVRERNQYRQLLDECLYAFNYLPNKRIDDGIGGNTYKIAAKIEQTFKDNDA